MKQNIQQLLNELVEHSKLKDSCVSSQAKGIIHSHMMVEFRRLEASQEQDKQAKMIAVFMGGVIAALNYDDNKYGSSYSDKLYPYLTLLKNANEAMGKKELPYVQYFYLLGNLAMKDLPNSFCGGLFTRKIKLINCDAPRPFFPELAENAAKVDVLVAFCEQNANNLEQADFEYESAPKFEYPSEDFVQDFIKKHKESVSSGCLGGFFHRTNLGSYEELNAAKILAHAKKTTFFGYDNRTCKILQEMKVIDANKNAIPQMK